MMNNNKILTVSYGTFSCTLEGFDDSFDTMKAIAEYFRDLASDDRYFGAEPPQPDAEMLAKIAEREVARRVEASEHDGRIMLKAHEDAEELTQPTPLVAPAQETIEPEDSFTPEPDTVTESAPEMQVTQTDAPELEDTEAVDDSSAAAFFANSPSVEDTPEENEGAEEISVEAFTGYIAAGAAEAAEAASSDDADSEDDQAAHSFAVPDTPVSEMDAQEFDAEFASEEAAEIVESDSSKMSENLEDLIIEPEETAAKSIFAAESFADKLQRIRAVVSQQDENDDDDVFEEDMEAPTDVAPLKSFDGDTAPVEDVAETPFVSEAAQDIETALMQDDDIVEEEAPSEGDELDEILGRIDADVDEDESLDATEEAHEATGEDNIFGDHEEAADDEETESVSVDGRILKVNRSALNAALETGELEEYDDEQSDTEQDFGAEDDQKLQENLAALKEIGDEDASDEVTADKVNARDSLPEIDETGNGVSRLMAEADQQMDEPEGKTRRSAFAHLRAAVAARFADRSMDKDVQEEEEKEAEVYRSDLAEVVKPRRPESGADEEKRAQAARPSPLKLVAEQRIDPEDMGLIDPVSPRRVAAGTREELILEEDTGFAGYADELGAHTLPEVLEAAAAYLCHVEGVDEFSRPQLMSRVKQAECGEFSREDGLRAFGQLLRTGKIEKIKGGRFVASDAIGFKPGHREAG